MKRITATLAGTGLLLLASCAAPSSAPSMPTMTSIPPTNTPESTHMMVCELENIAVHYEAFGEGRPLIVLHGCPSDHRSMVRAFEPLFESRDGWKRIYPDLPGMGETPGADWIANQDDVLDVVLNFIDCVVPGQTVSIAGYSCGGYLAQGVVYQKPALVDGIFLLAPSFTSVNACPLPHHVTLVEDKALIEELEPDEAEMFQSVTVVQNRKTVDEFKDFFRRANKLTDYEYLSRLENNWAFSFDVERLPEPFDRPALILTGRQDSVVGYCNAWGLLRNYPRATFAVLDRAGHPLPYEQEHLFQILVNEWLDRVEEYSGLAE